MQSKKLMITVLFNAFCITPAVLAMCTRTSAVRKTLSRAASARFSTINQRVAQASTATVRPAQKRMLTRQFSDSSGGGKHSYQESWQQAEAKDRIKKALGITGAVAIAAIIAEANEIAHSASETLSMGMFDENLISDEFSRAIVKIYGERGGQCSGCIISSEKNPSLYFVLTAAHCVSDNDYMHVKHPQYSDELIKIRLMQILIEPSTDVAIFLIPSREIRKFQNETGSVLPAIPANQLASIEPHKSEVILLQGYPDDTPNAYREKFMTKGHTTTSYTGQELTMTKLIPIEKHSPESLQGASGAPYIVIRDNRPEVQGVHSGRQVDLPSKVRSGPTYGGGFGRLPHYLQEAEKDARELQEKEQKARELRAAKNKP